MNTNRRKSKDLPILLRFSSFSLICVVGDAYQIIANEHVLTLRKDCMIHLATKYHHYSVIPPHLLMMEHHSLPR